MYFARLNYFFLIAIIALIAGCDNSAKNASDKNLPDKNLIVVIIRHAEKPASGDNLSCQGENRALQLVNVLYQKFKQPDYTYVPALKLDKNTAHSRMFQTVTPLAIKYNLTINSQYNEKDAKRVAKSVFKKTGTVLMVWEHSAIADLARALGVDKPPKWHAEDFDSIWIVTYANGRAALAEDREGLSPSANCSF